MNWINDPYINKRPVCSEFCRITGLSERSFYAKADDKVKDNHFTEKQKKVLDTIYQAFLKRLSES